MNVENLQSDEGFAGERHVGRQLDASRDDALREAALEQLAEIGYDRLTVDRIAAAAGAGKATIYRRWSGKAELVVDALMCQKLRHPDPDTGTLRGDLDTLVSRATELDRPMDTQVIIGLVSALPHDTELRDVFRERFIEPHTATLRGIFERAVARGEIEPVEYLDLVVSIVPALVLHRLLVDGTPPDEPFLRAVVDGLILPLVLVGSAASTPVKAKYLKPPQ